MQADDAPAVPSLPTNTTTTTSSLPPAPPAAGTEFLDAAFVSELLGSVDVDLNDPLIQAALAQLGAGAGASNVGGDENNAKKRKGPDSDST